MSATQLHLVLNWSLNETTSTQLTSLFPEMVIIGYVPIMKVHVCMCVCVELPRAYRLLRFTIENVSKGLDYPMVVYHGAILAFCGCSHQTGMRLATLKAEKHDVIKKPLMGAHAVFSKTYSYKRSAY